MGGGEVVCMPESRVTNEPLKRLVVASGMVYGVAVGKGAMGTLFGEMWEGGDSDGVGVGEAAWLCAVDDRDDGKPKVGLAP